MRGIINFKVLILFFLLFLPLTNVYSSDAVVAVVNNEVITQKDLNDFYNFTRMQYSRQFQGKELESKMQQMKLDLLDRLIEDRLILQEAKNSKVIINQDRVKSKLAEIRKGYQSEKDLERDLAKQGLVPADLETKIREQFLMFSMVEQNVRSKVVIGPDDITNFYDLHKQEFLSPETRELDVFTVDDEGIAKTLAYNLKLGKSDQELAGLYPFRISKLSVTAVDKLRKEIENVVFKLNVQEVSAPVQIDNQYYIFRLNDILSSHQLSLTEAQSRIHAYLFEIKIQESLTKWLDKLKKNSYIKINE